jgi:hypothetical protein
VPGSSSGEVAPARRPGGALLEILDSAVVAERGEDADLTALRDEARRGVTDGDVIMAFVTLVTVDHRSGSSCDDVCWRIRSTFSWIVGSWTWPLTLRMRYEPPPTARP